MYDGNNPDRLYCVLVTYSGSKAPQEGWKPFCSDEQPLEIDNLYYHQYQVIIFSGFPSEDYTSEQSHPKILSAYYWTDIYEFVWIGQNGCLFHSGKLSIKHDVLFGPELIRPCQVTPQIFRIDSAAFDCTPFGAVPSNQLYANPYYWRGRPDFDYLRNFKIKEEKENKIDPNSPSSSFPLLDGDQVASLPTTEDGITFDNNPLASGLDFTPFRPDSDFLGIISGGAASSGNDNINFFASTEDGGEGGSLSTDTFSVADLGITDSDSGLWNDFSIASNDDTGVNLFTKRRMIRGMAKARARARA